MKKSHKIIITIESILLGVVLLAVLLFCQWYFVKPSFDVEGPVMEYLETDEGPVAVIYDYTRNQAYSVLFTEEVIQEYLSRNNLDVITPRLTDIVLYVIVEPCWRGERMLSPDHVETAGGIYLFPYVRDYILEEGLLP